MSPLDKKFVDKFKLGVEVAGIGLGEIDYIADTILLDQRAATLFDLPANIDLPRDKLHDRIHPEDRLFIDHGLKQLLNDDGQDFIEVQHRIVRSDETVVWVNARKQVEFTGENADGDIFPESGLVALVDITSQKEAQAKAQFLMEELNHRSKNLISVVQSLARRTFMSGDVQTFPDRFSDRLAGLAHNLDALVKGNWAHADLKGLATAQLEAFGKVDGVRIKVDGSDTHLSAAAAQAVGMALHELATNAAKYGSLSVELGKVSLCWTLDEHSDGALVLEWIESEGPTVMPPAKTGFGQRVLKEMAAASVEGKVDLDYLPEGVQWRLTVPAKELV